MPLALPLLLAFVAAVAAFGLMFWLGTGERGSKASSALVFRLIVVFVPTTLACYSLLWLVVGVVAPSGFHPLFGLLGSLLAASVFTYFTCLRSTAFPPSRLAAVALGAFVTAGISFSAGFFGPMLFTPASLHAPLLGILLTGPLGFLFGAVGGFIYWSTRHRRRAPASQHGAG